MTQSIEEVTKKLDSLTNRIDKMSSSMATTIEELDSLTKDMNKLARSMVAINVNEEEDWDDMKIREEIAARVDGIERKSEKMKKKLHEMIWAIDSLAERVNMMAEEIKREAKGRW